MIFRRGSAANNRQAANGWRFVGDGDIMPGSRLDPKITAQWARVRGLMRSEVGDASYRSWLKPLTLVAVEEGEVHIAVPTRFMRDWVVSHYGDRLC